MHETDHYQLLLLDGHTVAELHDRVTRLIDLASEPTCGTLDNLAVNLRRALADRPMRTAVVADSAGQARERLTKLAAALRDDNATTIDVANGVFAGRADSRPAIGYLFPGQGANNDTEGSALTRRFETARDFYRTVTIPTAENFLPPSVFQQQIVASSVVGLRVLNTLGIEASMAAGHSLGELTALHWAGAMSESALLTFVAERGQIVARACTGTGAMMGIAASPDEVKPLLIDEPVVIVGYNNPVETAVAGPAEAVARVQQAALAASLKAERMPVRDAFHSSAMAAAADGLRAYLAGMEFGPLDRPVASTVTGDVLPSDTDLRELLVRQICEPVWFSQAVERMANEVSLLIEVGPSEALSYHASLIRPNTPAVPLSTDSTSLYGVLSVAAAAYVLGAPVRLDRLHSELMSESAASRHE
ncbi:ACP S-malonyltransferase [Kibdelosporangium aridum]|uniref:acyltransferase domain-containing protein n=1 Tax=Kibdelosporangium aridum TaxID=2030 RepID=UPI00163C4D00|nr:ACP S-malonyltransferase [Kibdelosporangium aridum]